MNTLLLKGAALQTEKLSALRFSWVTNRLAIQLDIATSLPNGILQRNLTKLDILFVHTSLLFATI